MVRSENNIRLTAAERGTLAALTGFAVNPKTVAEINQIVADAKAALALLKAETAPDEGETDRNRIEAEFRLVNAVADSFLVEA